VATPREIRKRIKSVGNTKKITKTMEMVSTAKMKKLQQRLEMTKPYANKLDLIISHIRDSAVDDIYDPLMTERANPSRIMIVTLTGNRGLCGGFNTNMIENTMNFQRKLSVEEGKDVLLYMIGKKGMNYFRFIGKESYKAMPNPEERFTFKEASELGNELISLFTTGEVDEVHLSYTKILTSSSQKPALTRLLPIVPDKKDVIDSREEFKMDYVFEPNAYDVMASIFPLYVKVKLYTSFLETNFSEHFARRVAMKNATDAASDMVRDLTISYNRARQAKITNEIAEIVGGAAAL
jgi:F-type H+-transporting ATPase subunit gamma